jgi:hypothetical protein
VGGHTYFGDESPPSPLCVCAPAHLTHTHTTCIELNFLEDIWDNIWWTIVTTWGFCKQGVSF